MCQAVSRGHQGQFKKVHFENLNLRYPVNFGGEAPFFKIIAKPDH